MKPILNTEDIKKLKIDERLIECSCGKVNYYRSYVSTHETRIM